MTTGTLDYEAQRLQNIKDNQELLLSLGLSGPPAKVATKAQSAKSEAARKAVIKRQKAKVDKEVYKPSAEDDADDDNEDDGEKPSPKRARTVGATTAVTGEPGLLRRSSRSVRSISRLGNESLKDELESDDESSPARGTGSKRKSYNEPQRNAKKLGVRTENPKQFGHIPGVEVGRCWATRMECSTDAVHAPTVAGISGNPHDGAWSIALSGGYPDDVDLGVAFTYTGCGGRDLKGTKQNPKNLRTAEQTSHQSFDWPLNAAIKRSAETKKPVRVIRGYKLPSPYAPIEGYRYDGLYIVEKAWMGKGLTKGLMVCRYAFKRVPGQPELPERDLEKELEELDNADSA